MGLGVVTVGLLSGGAWAQTADSSNAPRAPTQWHPQSNIQKPADVGKTVHTNIIGLILPETNAKPPKPASNGGVSPDMPPVPGLNYETPSSLACVYRFIAQIGGCNPNKVSAVITGGAGLAIAIVDAYHNPGIKDDLKYFDAQFNLPPPPLFQVVYAGGTQPAADPGWALEASLDVEWAHAMSPNAKLYLVEAASANMDDMMTAVDLASGLVTAAGGGVVSMSWGSSEWLGETAYDKHFKTPNVTYLAASGDAPGVIYPSSSAYVVAVGGTSLIRSSNNDSSNGDFTGEVAWADTGSGLSAYVARPLYQNSIPHSVLLGKRGVPDIAADADIKSGVWVLSTYNSAWYAVGGTSVATPVEAGILSHKGDKYLGAQGALNAIYDGRIGSFRDITSGICGPNNSYSAQIGWDLCTGRGSLLGSGQLFLTAGVTP